MRGANPESRQGRTRPHRQPPTSPTRRADAHPHPTLPPLADRVTAGARLLDRCRPGWATQLDPDRLDMAAEYDDLLGQLYGHYAVGLEELSQADPARPAWPWSTFAYEHGFDLAADDPTTYTQLDDAWRAELCRRRQGGGR